MMAPRLLKLFMVFVFAVSLPACEQQAEKRVYEEIVVTSSKRAPMEALPGKAPKINILWDLPVDWVLRESQGMRIATFSTGTGENLVECTIVSLEGIAGGLEPNVIRWMGQINLAPLSGGQLKDFLSKQEKLKTKAGQKALLVDLTQLQKEGGDSASSIIASVIELPQTTIFVKMTGSRANLSKNKEKFKSLCRSLRFPNE